MKPPAPGLYPDLPAAEYHADPALGSGAIKDVLESPARYRYRQLHPKKATDAMALGSLAHAMILEPETVADAFVRQPDEIKQRRGSAWDGFCAEAGDRTIVRADDYRRAEGMRRAVEGHPVARRLLSGRTEVSAFWTDQGVRLKARADALPEDGTVPLLGEDGEVMEYPCSRVIVDLKTTRSADIRQWTTWALERFGYHYQAGHYRRVLEACGEARERFVFVVVESEARILGDDGEPAHVVEVYEMRLSTLSVGEMKAAGAVRKVAACQETGAWTTQPSGPIKVVGLTEFQEEAAAGEAYDEPDIDPGF